MRNTTRREILAEDTGSPYYELRKYPEPTVCSSCNLVYHKGRWTNGLAAPPGANRELCPACKRVQDRNPGGVVYLDGSYLHAHRDEILNTAKNQEKLAREQRPLQRIMWIKPNENGLEIATTNFHLARRIGEAIHQAHKGNLDIKYSEGDRFARIYWHRDDQPKPKK
ncbi:MAG: BCAM0308 family protein [Candidatus Bipolaricaulia bacterium]